MNTENKNTLTPELADLIIRVQDACQELYGAYMSEEFPTIQYPCWLTRFMDECYDVFLASHEKLIDENMKEV